MIIELFGPPGVGKTTFSKALAAKLRESGQNVELILSDRPAEVAPMRAAPHPAASMAKRLIRPGATMIAMAGHLFAATPQDDGIAGELMRMLPPRSMIWSIRLRQYLLRLERSWQRAARTDHIVLFDQAFVQALCSLVLLGRAANRHRIDSALDIMPPPDLLIRLDAPPEVLRARLGQRQDAQGRCEQMLELGLPDNLGFMPIVDDLSALLCRRGRDPVRVDSRSPSSLCGALSRIEQAVTASSGAAHAFRSGA